MFNYLTITENEHNLTKFTFPTRLRGTWLDTSAYSNIWRAFNAASWVSAVTLNLQLSSNSSTLTTPLSNWMLELAKPKFRVALNLNCHAQIIYHTFDLTGLLNICSVCTDCKAHQIFSHTKLFSVNRRCLYSNIYKNGWYRG